MKSNKSTWFWVFGIVVVLGGLFAYPRLWGGQGSGGIGSGVPCLVPNVPLVQHIHPVVTITVDGVSESIPAGVGLAGCERAIHTHDEDAARGVIHVESQDRRSYTLGDFMSVWGKSFAREGYALTVTADGETITDPKTLILEDHQDIRIDYRRTQ